jgi:hypothetical protein
LSSEVSARVRARRSAGEGRERVGQVLGLIRPEGRGGDANSGRSVEAVALAGTHGPALDEELPNGCRLVCERPALATEAANDAGAIAWTVYLGAVPTALGFATWPFALGRTSAGRMGSITYLIPLVAILLGRAVLGEVPP